MAIVEEVRCDFCDTVLVGKKGIAKISKSYIAKISKSYIEISGFVRDWEADPHSGWRTQTFISDKDQKQMSFCTDGGATCLQDYVDMKRASQRVFREQKLREGATAEQFEVGHKKDYGKRY